MQARTAMGIGCIALSAGVAAISLLGPLVLKTIDYRTAETGLNQLKGADLASLALVAPAAAAAGGLWLRRHPLAPIVSLAPAAYSVYIYAQAILGEDYARYEGNNEQFFPLHLGLIVLGGTLALRSWSAIEADALPLPSERLRRTAAYTLIGSGLFLALGLHLPQLVAVWRGDPPAEARDAPAAFWVVKTMDLGLVLPVALATGAGLLRRSRTALKAAYALSGGFALLGASVTAMAVVMQANDDPSVSPVFTAGFGVITLAFAALTWRLVRSSQLGESAGDRGATGHADPGRLAERGNAL